MTRVELNAVDHIVWVDDDGTRYRREFDEDGEFVDKAIGYDESANTDKSDGDQG